MCTRGSFSSEVIKNVPIIKTVNSEHFRQKSLAILVSFDHFRESCNSWLKPCRQSVPLSCPTVKRVVANSTVLPLYMGLSSSLMSESQ